jgi:hypothetical protein
MTDTNRQVQHVIDEFVQRLTQIARETAAQIVLSGLGRANGVAKHDSPRGRGGKRSRESLEAMQSKVLGFIKSHPGLRIEEINRQLGTNTKELALPMKKLIAAKQIKAVGQRRATKYFGGVENVAKRGRKSTK